MPSRRTPVERLAINLVTAEKWASKGKTSQARDMLEACRVIHLPNVPAELREPWQRRLDRLARSLEPTSWQEGDGTGHDEWLSRSSPSPAQPHERDLAAEVSERARQSPVWAQLRDALADLRTVSVVLDRSPVSVRFDFVDSGPQVELWASWRRAPLDTWMQPREERFIQRSAVIGADDAYRPPSEVHADDDLLVWAFSDVADARVAVKEELLALSPDEPPQIRVRRRRGVDAGDVDRAVEAIVRRGSRESQGSQRFAVTTCASCGQPLSDPVSVRLGIGPDCLKNYPAAVIAGVRSWRPGSVRVTGISPRELAGKLREPW